MLPWLWMITNAFNSLSDVLLMLLQLCSDGADLVLKWIISLWMHHNTRWWICHEHDLRWLSLSLRWPISWLWGGQTFRVRETGWLRHYRVDLLDLLSLRNLSSFLLPVHELIEGAILGVLRPQQHLTLVRVPDWLRHYRWVIACVASRTLQFLRFCIAK